MAFGAFEGFFEGGEAGPGMGAFGIFGGDTPKIKGVKAFFAGVEDEAQGEKTGGVEGTAFGGLGALEVVADF